jgi:dTDP-4-dehydrorhamnose reductase
VPARGDVKPRILFPAAVAPDILPAMRILITGGSGRLGRELVALLPGAAAPSRHELDVTDASSVARGVERHRPDVLVHAAAYTDVAGAEQERTRCWRVNVVGTRNVAQAAAAAGALLVHISTDYVFAGTRGGYREDDPPGPVRNYYALSKLVAEEAARTASRRVIVRTSFRPREWPYPTAFTDLYTSQDYVDVIAPEIALLVESAARVPHEIVHIATERKSVYDLARRRAPQVRATRRAEAAVDLPEDVSLDVERWRALRPRLLAARVEAAR